MGSTTGSIIINVKGKDVTVGVNAPANPKDNELWLDTNDGQNILKYYSSKDKKWHNVNDMSGEFGKIYTELKTNYYTKKESDDSVKTIIGETTITKSDGKVVNMKDAINSVIDTSNSHTTQIGEIETKFSDYSTIEDVNSKITKAQQTSEDYTIEAIKNLNIGAANLINGSTIYTKDNKLSITATKRDFNKIFSNIYVDLEKDETYTFNFKTDGRYGSQGDGDTVETFFLKDRAYTTYFRISSLPCTFKCTESGRYYLRVDVNKKGSTHSFWNFKMERGDKATDWSINPVEEHAALKVSSDKINAVVSSLDSEGSITLTDKMAKVVADTISLNGAVKVNGNMLVDGAVTVDKIATDSITSDKIATGSVTADSIATDAIKSKNYNNGSMGSEKLGAYFNLADGTMTTPYLSWDKRGQLKCSSADISGKVTASSGKIGNWNIQRSVTNGIGSSGMLYSAINRVDSQGIGDKYIVHLAPINIYNEVNNTWVLAAYRYNMPEEKTAIANWFLTYGGEFYTTGRHRCMGTTYPQIFGNGSVLQLSQDSSSSSGVVIDGRSFRPAGDTNTGKNLGLSNHRWNTIFAASATIQTSDVNKKHDINELDDDVTKQLILGLIPKSYKFNDGTSGRTHYGLIAQDVEELLKKLEIDTKDFAGFVKSPKVKEYEIDKLDNEGNVVLDEGGNPQKELIREDIEGEYDYSLRYEEFISPLIKVVQEHEKEIEELKNKNTELENKYNDLLSRIEKLENAEGSNQL